MKTIAILLAIATLGVEQGLGLRYTATMMPPWWLVGRGIGTVTFVPIRPGTVSISGTITGLDPNKAYGIWVYSSKSCGYLGNLVKKFTNSAATSSENGNFITDDKGVLYIKTKNTGVSLNGPNSVLDRPIVIRETGVKNLFDYTCGRASKWVETHSCCTTSLFILKARLFPWFTCCGMNYT